MRIARSFRVLILGPEMALGFGWMVHLVCLLAWLVVLNFVLCHSSVSGTLFIFLSFLFNMGSCYLHGPLNINYLGGGGFDGSH